MKCDCASCPRPRVRARFLIALGVVLGLGMGVPSLRADITTSGNKVLMQVLGTDGSTIVNVGDAANTAVRVNVVAGSSGNSAASATGSAVPAAAGYDGINVAGTLRGATGVNPSGSIFAQQIDFASIAGVTAATGNGVVGTGVQRVAIASDNTAFSVNAAQSGTWTVQPGNTANTTAWKVDGSAVTQPVSGTLTSNQGGTWTVQPGNTANTTPWLVKSTLATSCGTTQFSSAWAAVPTTNTAVTGTTTCVGAIIVTNTNATPQTLAVTDGQGSPITIVATLSIPGNSTLTIPMYGTQATTGLKWIAGGTGLTGAVVGLQ